MNLWRIAVLGFIGTIGGDSVQAQDVQPLDDHPSSHYFDFWEGTWHQVVDGHADSNRTTFQVHRGVHRAAFIENWHLVIDSETSSQASALRAWDKTAQRWMYTWVSDNGLFQVWEGRQLGSDWCFYREFDVQGDRYLSRQAWIPAGPDRLIRISERSNDGGRTWLVRFREEYRRVK
jgi:hypothetical protein